MQGRWIRGATRRRPFPEAPPPFPPCGPLQVFKWDPYFSAAVPYAGVRGGGAAVNGPSIVAARFSQPRGLALTPEGDLIVADAGEPPC